MYSQQVNYAIGFVGNVTKHNDVTRFGIAMNTTWTDKDTNEKRERTDWLNFTAFGKTAENIAKYLKKGAGVKVDYTIRPNSYEKDGVEHNTYDLIVDGFNILCDPTE